MSKIRTIQTCCSLEINKLKTALSEIKLHSYIQINLRFDIWNAHKEQIPSSNER